MENELKDYLVSDDLVDAAERQTKDACRGTVSKLWSGDDWMASMAAMGANGGGVEWWRRKVTAVVDAEGTDVEVPLCPQW